VGWGKRDAWFASDYLATKKESGIKVQTTGLKQRSTREENTKRIAHTGCLEARIGYGTVDDVVITLYVLVTFMWYD